MGGFGLEPPRGSGSDWRHKNNVVSRKGEGQAFVVWKLYVLQHGACDSYVVVVSERSAQPRTPTRSFSLRLANLKARGAITKLFCTQ
jgi:hypothetical protein